MSAEPFYPYRLSSRGQFSLPVSEAVRSCASPVCLCVFAWLPAKSLEMTTSPLNRGTVKLREVRPPLRCEWAQKALNTTELPRAHIDFLAEARVLGRGNWKRQQGQAGGSDLPNCPSPTTAPTAQIYHRCGRMWWRWWGTPITLQPKGAGLCHWAAPTERRFCQSVGRSNECLPYLWIPEKSNMCGALTNDERQKARELCGFLPGCLSDKFSSWAHFLMAFSFALSGTRRGRYCHLLCIQERNTNSCDMDLRRIRQVQGRNSLTVALYICSPRNIKCSFTTGTSVWFMNLTICLFVFWGGGLPKSL